MMGNLIIGSYYCYSNINPYLAAYLNSKSLERSGHAITQTDTLLVMPIWLVTQSAFSILAVRLADKVGYWILNLLSFSAFALINLLASYITDYSIFILVYGFGSGMAIGFGYLPALYISWTYFPEKKSVVTGAILFCAGISGVILSPITTRIANPDNRDLRDIDQYPDVYNNVPYLLRFLAVYFGSLALVGGLLQPPPYKPKEKKNNFRSTLEQPIAPVLPNNNMLLGKDVSRVQRRELTREFDLNFGEVNALLVGQLDNAKVENLVRYNENIKEMVRLATQVVNIPPMSALMEKIPTEKIEINQPPTSILDMADKIESQECPSMKAAVLSLPFLLLCILAYCCSMYNYWLNSAWKKFFPTKFDVADSEMALLLSIGAFSNSLFRLFMGLLLTKFSFKTLYLVNVTIATVSAFTVNHLATEYYRGAIYLALAFGGLGTQITLMPTICLKLFGGTYGPKIYPCVFFLFSAASMTQYGVLKLAHDNYQLMCTIFGSVSAVGLVLGIFFRQHHDWTAAIAKEKASSPVNDK